MMSGKNPISKLTCLFPTLVQSHKSIRIPQFGLFFIILFFISNSFFSSPALAYTTNMNASVVVGQSDFTSSSANQGGAANRSANTLSAPINVVTDGRRLFVVDFNNNRVLIYNSIPTMNNAAADVVVGQTNFTGGTANQGGSVGANTLNLPLGIDTDGTRLFICDDSNRRLLIFNSIPTTNNTTADIVLGQANMTTVTTGTTQQQMNRCNSVSFDPTSGKLVVNDNSNNRILVWNKVPTFNFAPADVVIGQNDFTSTATGTGPNRFVGGVRGALVRNGKLLVHDQVVIEFLSGILSQRLITLPPM